MASSSDPTAEFDMNDESNLDLYSKLLLFKNEASRDDIIWHHAENTLQRTLQSLAYKLDLDMSLDPMSRDFEFLDFQNLEGQHSFQDGDFGLLNPNYSDNWNTQPLTALPQSHPRFDTTVGTAPDSSASFLEVLKWSSPETNGLFEGIPTELSPAESEFQPLNSSADDIYPDDSFFRQFTQFGAPVASGINSNPGSSEPQIGPAPRPSYPPRESNPRIAHNDSSRLDDNAQSEALEKGGARPDLDMDDSDDSMMIQRLRKFYCTDYPPCSLSFTRREHLARHIRKHTGERPFQCHLCSQTFSRLDNLRQHAQTIHVYDATSIDSSAGNETRFQHHVRSGASASTRRNATKLTSSKPLSSSSRRNSATNIYEIWGSSPGQAASTSGSASSLQSDRGRTAFKGLFSRRSSTYSNAGSGYEDIVFDSKSATSGSQDSGASGRRGPLDAFAKSAMNAVKRVGACWRCKFLRKSCSTESPCNLCSQRNPRSKTDWGVVGCKRGELRKQMAPIHLCPAQGAINPNWLNVGDSTDPDEIALNKSSRLCKRHSVSRIGKIPLSLYTSIQPRESTPPALRPLNECILAIAWELNDQSSARGILNVLHIETIESLVTFLRSAAIYQSKLESDQLIAQSLICLRSCLEVLRVKDTGHFQRFCHRFCLANMCNVECIANLDLNLNLYLDELSRVLFKKENLKTKEGYWISAFYSFCIQSTVRKVLCEIAREGYRESVSPTLDRFLILKVLASDQFLHVAINLFVASSGTYDPLKTDYSIIAIESLSSYEKDLISLQEVLGVSVKNSGEYLKKIFETEEVAAAAPSSPLWNPSTEIPIGHRLHPPSAAPCDSPLSLVARNQAARNMAANMQRLDRMVVVATSENLDT